ncbi:MAG: NAD-dependent epimerase/dehydratase family protein [Deltaproteobacteria bacterium]|nr:NAD-dependent epimerase/dehydratase family protein [Deltaproteobacteria bacterium]
MAQESLLYRDEWSQQIEADVSRLPGPILVVGASGFLGARLFFSLAGRRKDVYAASRDPYVRWRFASLPDFVSPAQLVQLDLTAAQSVRQVCERLKPRTVFNLSAYGAYERQQQVGRIHEVNYTGVLNLVLGLQEVGCEALVHAGSSSEYGLNCASPAESAELVPNSDYAAAKVAASYLLKYYGRIHSFPCAVLRLYSVYGPFEERDRLIPRLVGAGLQGGYPPLAHPATSRDFVYVDDATAAFVRAALTICKTDPGLSVNIATGRRTTLEDVARAAKQVFGLPSDPVFGAHHNRKWDLSNWYGNPALAEQKLGWKAEVSFERGLRLTADWERAAEPLLKAAPAQVEARTVSMIIACYRDHQAIPIMYERIVKAFEPLRPRGYSYEIIFVNDCSPANDEEVIAGLCRKDPNVVGISHSRNFGSQSAFLSGLEASTGDAVVFMDGDLQDPPELIPELIDAWEKGADIVYGQRVKRDAPLHMQVAYKLFYRVFSALASVPIPRDAGDFGLINRRAAQHLLQFSERDIFLRGLRAWVGFKQIGVPYARPERLFGRTTNSLLKNIWWAKKGIFSFSTKPLSYIQALGVTMFFLTLASSVFYFVNYFVHPPKDATGITTVVLLTLGLGGVQLISLSVLGDYIGRVLEEVKSRPRFIRARVLRGAKVLEQEADIAQFIDQAKGYVRGKHR